MTSRDSRIYFFHPTPDKTWSNADIEKLIGLQGEASLFEYAIGTGTIIEAKATERGGVSGLWIGAEIPGRQDPIPQ